MMSFGGGDGEGPCFDRGFLGDRGRLLRCLHGAYIWFLGDPMKNAGATKRVLDIIRIKIRHFINRKQ